MKKLYTFFTLLMCTLFSLTASAQETEETGRATFSIEGTFHQFSVQDVNVSDPREAEILSVEGEVMRSIEIPVDGERTIRLVGQAENNAIYVTLNGQKVASQQDAMFQAEVTIKAGDEINVLNAEPSTGVAIVNINGNFLNVTAQDVNIADNRAAEVFSFQPEDGVVNETIEVAVNETKTIKLSVNAEDNAVYVELNGQKVASAIDGMFQAEITLRAGDVLNILNAEPSTGVAIVNINGNFLNVTAQDVNIADNRAAEVFSFQPEDGVINETIEVAVNETKTIRLTVQNENNEVYVALNGEKVASAQDGMFQAEITLRAGDVLNILNAEPSTGVAIVNINGNFLNVTAQDVNIADNRAAEVFSFQPEDGVVNETIEVAVNETKTIRLTVQNENNEVYVALNGEKVASAQDGMFQAEITLRAGDVLDILNAEPSTGVATVNINGNFLNVTAQDVNIADNRAAEVFSFQPEDGVVNETIEVAVNETKTIRLTVQNENNEVYVALNGEKVASAQDGMFQAEITLRAGDVLDILNAEPSTGVAIVNINGNFLNVTAQDVNIADNRAAEVFSFQPEDGVVNETIEVAVNETKTIRLTVQNEDNEIYVSLDGQEVVSDQDGMFQAVITLKAGSVLNIANNWANAINTVNAVVANGKVYNMQGMEVKADKPGLYIMNGKKVMVK